MQNIGVDCRLAGIQHAGIGRYIENLVKRLPISNTSYHWTFFFFNNAQAQQVLGELITHTRVKVVISPIDRYSLAEQFQLPRIFQKEKLDLLHVPHFNVPLFYRGKLVITIHDLLWHEYQGLGFTTLSPWLYYMKYVSYRFIVDHAVKNASHIIVPAKTIQQTLEKFYPNLSAKISVTKEGADEQISARIKKGESENSKKILVYVGSLYPHKNLKVVLQALHQLIDFELWIVGTRNVFQERVRTYVEQQKLTSQVHFLGYVPDKELGELLAQSFALVQPSLSEGFGLTGVEAMAMNVPVFASDIPIFHEIYQDGVVYFDPHSADSFVQAAQKFEKLPQSEKEDLVARAKKIARQYSWQKMAEETLEVYQKALQ